MYDRLVKLSEEKNAEKYLSKKIFSLEKNFESSSKKFLCLEKSEISLF